MATENQFREVTKKVRLIDANEPINAFKRYAKHHPNATWNAFGIEEVLNAAKVVDAVEVVHANWIAAKVKEFSWQVKCSNCGRFVNTTLVPYNYCPNCGAKMDGDN